LRLVWVWVLVLADGASLIGPTALRLLVIVVVMTEYVGAISEAPSHIDGVDGFMPLVFKFCAWFWFWFWVLADGASLIGPTAVRLLVIVVVMTEYVGAISAAPSHIGGVDGFMVLGF